MITKFPNDECPVLSLPQKGGRVWPLPKVKMTPYYGKFQGHFMKFNPLFYAKTRTKWYLKMPLFLRLQGHFRKITLIFAFQGHIYTHKWYTLDITFGLNTTDFMNLQSDAEIAQIFQYIWIRYFKFQICCIDYRFWFYSTFIQPNFAWTTWISLALNIRNPLNNFGFSFATITQPQTLRLLITPVHLNFCYGLKLAIKISAVG